MPTPKKITHWRGKALADMSKTELMEALNELANLYRKCLYH